MKQRFFVPLFFILLIVPVRLAFAQEAVPAVTVQEGENGRQLRIFREALLQGSSEQIRVEAAVELLLRNDPDSRGILLTALKTPDNPPARQAVCKALIKSRGLGQTIGSREEFLEPLLQVLITASHEQAMTAAEALLLFDYSAIESALGELLKDIQTDRQLRINAVYALQIRPEPQALRSLIGLLDDPDSEISKAAENALQDAFGIPVGTSRKVWTDILEELKQKSPDDIRRERLLRQEMRLRQMQTERDRWQKLYFALLDRQYDLADEAGKAKMTLETLSSELVSIRLWALGRVAQYQSADKEALKERLFGLLSDESRDVRLQTAKVLNNMSALNPGQKLLDRFKVENDAEVSLAMFEALGEACFFAFSRGSGVELPASVKDETLNIAVQYLFSEQTETSRKAAEVIRKILELNNLPEDSLPHYLGVLNERYQQAVTQNPVLRADLLSIMANLCGQGLSKVQASKLYEAAFIEGMTVADNPSLRLAGLRGMINIDPAKAYGLSQRHQLMTDESPAVRLLVIQLAGTVGGKDDLEWLAAMLNANGQAEPAWQSIKSILQRQKSTFLLEWIEAFEKTSDRDDYIREILELAEQKASAEKAAGNLLTSQKKIIQWYAVRRAWEEGVLYLDKIQYTPAASPFDDSVNAEIAEIYMYSGNAEKAAQLVEQELLGGGLAELSPIYVKVDSFLNDKTVTEQKKREFLDALLRIQAPDTPQLEGFITGWLSVLESSVSLEVDTADLENSD
ncbi:MAG: HEAT repeat domain-containing protein [Chitinivibrionales bacterium]|nr:HEAT repeat domain-containing protein [Chitinivibrionales bacterium]